MRACTRCSAEIAKGEKHSRTKLGSHHKDCVGAAIARCGERLSDTGEPREWQLQCKENDNLIRFEQDNFTGAPVDGEFHFSDPLGKTRFVFGLNDILEALRLAGIGVRR